MNNSFGDYLVKLRGKLSLREVAEKANLSHTYIRYLELGKKKDPSPETLRKLSNIYRVPYLELMLKIGYVNQDDIMNYLKR